MTNGSTMGIPMKFLQPSVNNRSLARAVTGSILGICGTAFIAGMCIIRAFFADLLPWVYELIPGTTPFAGLVIAWLSGFGMVMLFDWRFAYYKDATLRLKDWCQLLGIMPDQSNQGPVPGPK